MTTPVKYGFWRTDKPREEGYSHELISGDFEAIKDSTDMDTLDIYPAPGITTIFKAFQNRASHAEQGKLNFLGTRVGTKYEWMNFKEAEQTARNFAAGAEKLGLCPDIEAEGKIWRFIGIQAKNRKEWNLIHLANMYLRTTTVALYDTLGVDASKYVINQTEMITIACSKDLVHKIVDMKLEDDKAPEEERKLFRLKYVVCFEGECDIKDLETAD